MLQKIWNLLGLAVILYIIHSSKLRAYFVRISIVLNLQIWSMVLVCVPILLLSMAHFLCKMTTSFFDIIEFSSFSSSRI